MEKRSIIKQSSTIQTHLRTRFEELGLSYTQIGLEAQRFGISNVNAQTLSRYFSGKQQGKLSEESIIYLCYRYGIPVTLNVGVPVVRDGKIVHVIPKYNEQECIEKIKALFQIKEEKAKETAKAATGMAEQPAVPQGASKA